MPNDMNWRDVINRYLDACREDQRVGARAEAHTHRMLVSSGSSKLIRSITENRAVRIQRSEQSLGAVEGYTLIEESRDIVVAEVDRVL